MKVRIGRRQIDVKRTLTDRIVGYLSPSAGIERLKARTMMALAGGYEGGRRDRRQTRNWRPKEASANADTLVDLPDLRARSRDLVRNNPIATGAVATVVTNAIGGGLMLQAQIDRDVLGLDETAAEAWQMQAEREWELFCETADFTRSQTFYEMQALALRSVLESGDLLVVRRYREDKGDTYGTKVQFVEADRICNEARRQDTATETAGVVFDEHGVATAFRVANRHPDDYTAGLAPLSWSRVPARDPDTGRVLSTLLFDRLRPDLARGVPYLAPVVEALKELGDYTDHEARAALVSAMFTAFVTTPSLEESDAPVIGSDDSATGVERGKEIALEDAGAIVELDPGQKIEVADPNRPNTAFDGFVLSLCRQIGVALELPFEILVKHFTASYSAARAALEMAWQLFRKRREFIAWRLCQPTYEWVIEEAVARGRLPAPGFFADPIIRQAYCGAEWIGPARINLDPKKEAEADSIDVLELRTKTRKQIIMERTGGTWRGKLRQLAREEADLVQMGIGGQAAAPAARAPEEPEADPNQPEEGERT